MTTDTKSRTILLLLIALPIAALLTATVTDNGSAWLFFNSVVVNIIDPIAWLVAFPFAAQIRTNKILLPTLFLVALALAVTRLYLSQFGTRWIVGSIAGNVVCFMIIGYIINVVAARRRARRVGKSPSV